MSGQRYVVELDEDDLMALNWMMGQLPAVRLMNTVNSQVTTQRQRMAQSAQEVVATNPPVSPPTAE
jgi:hypothetical protein